MLKIIKNDGRYTDGGCGKCKYLLYTDEFSIGELYAKVRLKPVFWYIVAKIKGNTYSP